MTFNNILTVQYPRSVNSLAWDWDNELLAIGSSEYLEVRDRWDLEDVLFTLNESGEERYGAVCFQPNGSLMSTIAEDTGMRHFDTADGFNELENAAETDDHAEPYMQLRYTSSGDYLVAPEGRTSADRNVWIWEPGGNEEWDVLELIENDNGDIRAVITHPAGYILWATRDGHIHLHEDTPPFDELDHWSDGTMDVYRMMSVYDGRRLFMASDTSGAAGHRLFRITDDETLAVVRTWDGSDIVGDHTSGTGIARDGSWIVLSDEDNGHWLVQGHPQYGEHSTLGLTGNDARAAFEWSDDSQLMATADSNDEQLNVYETSDEVAIASGLLEDLEGPTDGDVWALIDGDGDRFVRQRIDVGADGVAEVPLYAGEQLHVSGEGFDADGDRLEAQSIHSMQFD